MEQYVSIPLAEAEWQRVYRCLMDAAERRIQAEYERYDHIEQVAEWRIANAIADHVAYELDQTSEQEMAFAEGES